MYTSIVSLNDVISLQVLLLSPPSFSLQLIILLKSPPIRIETLDSPHKCRSNAYVLCLSWPPINANKPPLLTFSTYITINVILRVRYKSEMHLLSPVNTKTTRLPNTSNIKLKALETPNDLLRPQLLSYL